MHAIGLRGVPLYFCISTCLAGKRAYPYSRACPRVLEELNGRTQCGFDLKEIASKQGLFPVSKLQVNGSGGIEYSDSSVCFPSLWVGPGSDTKVSFDRVGTFELPEQFLAELEVAMRDEGLFTGGSDVVRADLIYLYPDPESAAGGATVAFLDNTVNTIFNKTLWDVNRSHPDSYLWEKFTKSLVFKTNCVAQQIAVDKDKAGELFQTGKYLLRTYSYSCGVELEARLVAQMQATNVAMRMMFEEIAGLGRCLYPCSGCLREQQNFKNRKYCGKLLLRPMTLADDGRLGLLSLAISFATAYSKVADSIVNPKYAIYKDIVAKQFRCTYEGGQELKLVEMLKQVHKKRKDSNRANICKTVIAHHRAFERTFLRFLAAIRAWMQTFGRGLVSTSYFSFSRYPCAELFADPIHNGNGAFCQAEAFKETNDSPIDESNSCEDAADGN